MPIEQIASAQRIAISVHVHQVDRAGAPYIEHVESVARNVEESGQSTDIAVIAAWLHDTVEDTTYTLDKIRDEFGKEVAEVVHLLTRKEDQSPHEYYRAIKANPDALTVKLADIRDNTRHSRISKLPLELQERLKMKYSLALQELTGADS